MIALGLLVLVAAGVTALVGALANSGSDHALARSFEIFGYHLHGSTGRLFLYGVIVGAACLLGLGMMLSGLRRSASRRLERRHERKETRGEAETLQQERDRLAAELDHERDARARAEAEASRRPVAVTTPVAGSGTTSAGPLSAGTMSAGTASAGTASDGSQGVSSRGLVAEGPASRQETRLLDETDSGEPVAEERVADGHDSVLDRLRRR